MKKEKTEMTMRDILEIAKDKHNLTWGQLGKRLDIMLDEKDRYVGGRSKCDLHEINISQRCQMWCRQNKIPRKYVHGVALLSGVAEAEIRLINARSAARRSAELQMKK